MDQVSHEPGDVAFAEQQEAEVGGQRVFVRPAEMDLGWLAGLGKLERHCRERVGDGDAAEQLENKPALFFDDLDQRQMFELAGVAEDRLDEQNRHIGSMRWTRRMLSSFSVIV